jgi:hypothetical protein
VNRRLLLLSVHPATSSGDDLATTQSTTPKAIVTPTQRPKPPKPCTVLDNKAYLRRTITAKEAYELNHALTLFWVEFAKDSMKTTGSANSFLVGLSRDNIIMYGGWRDRAWYIYDEALYPIYMFLNDILSLWIPFVVGVIGKCNLQ